MKKAICTTTIYPPSKALLRFIEIAEEDGWHIFVAGDQKTPHEEYCVLEERYSFFHYLAPNDQVYFDPALSRLIGWNCIQRRNFAFLAAHQWGAEVVATVDDDNIPMEGWGRDLMIGREIGCQSWSTTQPCSDPIFHTDHANWWHRGFPIQLISKRDVVSRIYVEEKCTPDIQADFWNGDPDVDAICRMEHNPKGCVFSPSLFPFTTNRVAPFNSQNTFLLAKVMPHYFMMPGVGRSDDIWPAFHAQAQGFRVVFGQASVIQERNVQDVMRNFEDELLNYRHNLAIVKGINAGDKDAVLKFLPERALMAFRQYQTHFNK